MRPYAKYVDTGVDCIGQLPVDWQVVALRHLVTKMGSGVTPRGGAAVYTEEGVAFIRSQNVHFDGLRLGNVQYIPEAIHYQMSGTHVQMNDVLLNITGASIGRCCLVQIDMEMNVNQHVCIIRTNAELQPSFLNLVLQSDLGQTQVRLGITGGNRDGLNLEQLKDFVIPVPRLDEQEKIAAYLDHTTALIDQLIEKNTVLLKLLDNQRKAIINETVTKGLDPKAPMKESGIGWLGDVPKHWRGMKIKHLFEFRSGATPSTKNPLYWNGTIPWVSSKDMKTKYIERTEDYITAEGLANSSCFLIEPGCIIIVSRSGILQRTIPVAINKVPLVVNQDQKVLRPLGACTAEFFYHYVKGHEANLLMEWIKSGATVESIEIETFMDHTIYLPPVQEQEEIVDHLLKETQVIEAAKQKITAQQALLAAYRQSIISEAVTGKIDLREWEPATQQVIRS